MKRNHLFFLFIGLLSLAMTSCTKDDLPTVANATKTLESDDWVITQFLDDGKDELYHFSGYSFSFGNGVVTATKTGAAAITGTYSKGTDDSTEKFIMDFGDVDPFDELNEDWEVLESTSSKIYLKHVSGGNGGTDYLTFEKK
jgi:hypothetical protein